MVVGDKMFLLNDDSELFMYRIGNGNATLLDSYRVIEDGADAWGPLAFVDGYLLLRDSRTLVCIDIRK
jgi:outer membrane protein assembly factor BamB